MSYKRYPHPVRRSRWRGLILYLLFALFLCIFMYWFCKPTESDQATLGEPVSSKCTITMLDVGQGLSLLVEADGHYLLYDGGGREYSSNVISYLRDHDVDHLDYVIASHYDEDHIAGLVGCLRNLSVDTLLCPDYSSDTAIYTSFLKAADQSQVQILHPTSHSAFALGDAHFIVLGPEAFDSNFDNNNSIAIRIQYDQFSCLITGDAETEEVDYICRNYSSEALSSNIYIVGHHGSQYSTSRTLLNAVSPDYAWISCGMGNSYGHPTSAVMQLLKSMNIPVYRTDLQGDVSCLTDGQHYIFSDDDSDNYLDGSRLTASLQTSQAADESHDQAEHTYVLNTSSMKFHLPDCEAVLKMSSRNRKDVTAVYDDLIEQGYDPCHYCNP